MTRMIALPLILLLGWSGIGVFVLATELQEDQYVSFGKLDRCPRLPPRIAPPRDARDVRPDDIKVIMALGDSITAGLLARGERRFPGLPWVQQSFETHQAILQSSPKETAARDEVQGGDNFVASWQEYRGLSYPIGADPGAITLHNILQYWSPEIQGGSTGVHVPISCLGPICGHPSGDGLNAAISGNTASNLHSQVVDYLLPSLRKMEIKKEDWKLVNIGIGGNDICAFCLTPNSSIPLMGTPKQFAADIKHAVEHLREQVPNIIVNIVGSLRVSSLYELTKKDPYCSNPIRTPITPRLPLECSCALLPGPAGDYTRQKMDDLGQAYDEAVIEVIREWEAEDAPDFGVIWQPGAIVDLPNWPIESLSPVDCFHPSEKTHQRVAAGIWNRLTKSLEERARPIVWEEDVLIRCLREDDRLPVGRTFE